MKNNKKFMKNLKIVLHYNCKQLVHWLKIGTKNVFVNHQNKFEISTGSVKKLKQPC